MEFNLILHGMMAVFADNGSGFLDICIPQTHMDGVEVHVAKMGQFIGGALCIFDLEKGSTYEIKGLNSNKNWEAPHSSCNLVLMSSTDKTLKPRKEGIFAHLLVPKPTSPNLQLRPMILGPIGPTDDLNHVISGCPTTASEITVFQYGNVNSPPTLDGPTRYQIKEDSNRKICNLIVYAEPPTKQPHAHFHLFTDMITVNEKPLRLLVTSLSQPAGPDPHNTHICVDEQKCHFDLQPALEINLLNNHGGCSLGHVIQFK